MSQPTAPNVCLSLAVSSPTSTPKTDDHITGLISTPRRSPHREPHGNLKSSIRKFGPDRKGIPAKISAECPTCLITGEAYELHEESREEWYPRRKKEISQRWRKVSESEVACDQEASGESGIKNSTDQEIGQKREPVRGANVMSIYLNAVNLCRPRKVASTHNAVDIERALERWKSHGS
ncbi:hypothetical protein QBC41DRAFT_308231 [Cercophora samala]|uniref:Uncharacterized protein n=1 Tax=Cercophora samala TaxID=330535 RepID=A0AA40D0K4_9PEZI|nr:hypothetical protein QBC41DRAFT_308231 [Cercophora samala]